MKMNKQYKYILSLVIIFSFMVSTIFSQTTLKGVLEKEVDNIDLSSVEVTVTDLENNIVITKASVNDSGTFEIKNLLEGTYLLSFTGDNLKVVNKVFTVTDEEVIDVNLMALTAEDVVDTVIVTALGIEQDKRTLGYTESVVKKDTLEKFIEPDIGRVLQNKVPGVAVKRSSGVVGTGTNIIIRGYSSISGSNSPLFIIDGIPIDSSTYSDRSFTAGGSTASGRLLDIDPNNVESITVLKSLNATALYGEAGRNGVVIITTKSGSFSDKDEKISYSSIFSINQTKVASLPDTQTKYGNGWQNRAAAAFSNWGAPFDQPNRNGLTDTDGDGIGEITHPYDRSVWNDVFPQYVGARWKYQNYDSLKNFFDTGTGMTYSFSASGKINNVIVNGTYSWLRDEGYVQYNDRISHSLSLGAKMNPHPKVKLSSSVTLSTSETNKPFVNPSRNSNATNVSLFGNVMYTPKSWDIFALEYERPDTHGSVYYRSNNGMQHPLWTLHNSLDTDTTNRMIGNMNVSYDHTEDTTLSYRLGFDYLNLQNNYMVNKGGVQGYAVLGQFETSHRNNLILDHDIRLQHFFTHNSLTFDNNAGFTLKTRTYDVTQLDSSDQFMYDFFDHSNFSTTTGNSYKLQENTYGLYASSSIGYNDYFYVTGLLRQDWTSTLEKEYRDILYPSLSMSFVVTDYLDQRENGNNTLRLPAFVNNLRVIMGYGTSAGFPNPYSTRNSLSTTTNLFKTNSNRDLNSNTVSNFYANPLLKPELHEELSYGIALGLFNNRFTGTINFYDRDSDDLIINLDLDPSTGYTSTTTNAASINNTGTEIDARFVAYESNSSSWTMFGNWSKNESIVTKIAPGIDKVYVGGYVGRGNVAIVGQPYGVMEGDIIKRDYGSLDATDPTQVHWDDRGDYTPIVNSNGGYQHLGYGIIGDPNPDWRATLTNVFSYKNFDLSFTFSLQMGGDIFSTTISTLTGRGLLGSTGFDRMVPVVTTGLKNDGSVNTKQTTTNAHYWPNTGVFYDENSIYDASHIKLDEVTLSYTAPDHWLKNINIVRKMIFTITANNYWFNAWNTPEDANFDPDVLSYGSGANAMGFDEMTGPTAKRIGFSIKLEY